MKITVEVECTPIEARQFMGLPDVQPMQDAILAEVEKRMLAHMDRFSPEGVLNAWLALFPQNPQQVQELFGKLFKTGQRRSNGAHASSE
jgi:hypothetical protein